MDCKMTDRVWVDFGHSIFTLLPEIVIVYTINEKIYVIEMWKKIFLPFFSQSMMKSWKSGTENGLKVINQNKISSTKLQWPCSFTAFTYNKR